MFFFVDFNQKMVVFALKTIFFVSFWAFPSGQAIRFNLLFVPLKRISASIPKAGFL
jgi:hypothetical protein